MRNSLYSYVLLFLMLPACNTAPANLHEELFGEWSIDSLKQALRAQSFTPLEEMKANANLGIRQNIAGDYDSGRVYLKRALELPGGREYHGGRLIVNLANSYGFQGQYSEALKYYMEALQWSEKLANENTATGFQARFNIIRTMANMAEIHYLTGNREQALFYAGQARERGYEMGESYITPQYLYIIGSVYLDKGRLDEAEEIMRETYEMADVMCRARIEDLGNDMGMYMYVAYGLEGLAHVSLAKGDHESALEYAAEALDYAVLHGDPMVTAKMLSVLSDIYLAMGNFGESGVYASQALEIYPQHAKLDPSAVFNLATARLFEGNPEEAYEYFHLYSQNVKENTDKQFRETMAGLQIQYEIEKKEARISSLEMERMLFAMVGIVAVLLILALWMVARQKIRNHRQEKQLVAANAIFDWEKKERKRFAGELHDGINGMLSAVKFECNTTGRSENISRRLDNCIETIRRMARGLMPSSLERYGLKAALEDYCKLFPNVRFHFYGDEIRIDEKVELMIYYCAYELINNSFKHSGAATIHVQLVLNSGSISLTVHDDGCGYDPKCNDEESGLKNIKDRVAAINGNIDIESGPGKGTETTIHYNIPKL